MGNALGAMLFGIFAVGFAYHVTAERTLRGKSSLTTDAQPAS
jgi:hypothetical protein